ncbi:dTDP-4-dehydrorhamnose 3,5-epimerase [Motilibacter rhizosphaerae]|uniref:dTDP-4-dehydrorhamnose 3,5-epimerase n=1 Tax=Motilibacter rhizosphaerae TaxID=598652 RepID=A0A4Q7NQ16_9ACTN|nr:dTDP-4-dehydrorhamnose 3,5-epimerase [Motilibacter rhizosphaerae]RZS87379.1 dTDP-4-dehydrorhamnose 3,5-epimerase [Motilibacter rhizosphaerae]
MKVRQLGIEGAYEVAPAVFGDARGVFLEWFKQEVFEAAVGRPLDLKQANCSVSSRGVLRGIHFADVPPGQAKYVTCLSGAVLDVVVDIRVGSPSFGTWESVLLDDADRRAVFLSEGLGHAFVALTDGAVVSYLCSEGYAPAREHGISPLDEQLAVEWPVGREELELSAKDLAAPTLAEAQRDGLLPSYDACRAFVAGLAR